MKRRKRRSAAKGKVFAEGVRVKRRKGRSTLDSKHPHVFTTPGKAFLTHFEREGYAVLRDVLGRGSRKRFLQGFWNAAKHIIPGLKLGSRDTWRFPTGYRGIMASYGWAQSDFAWEPRLAPNVRKAFAALFGVSQRELVVSLDAVLLSDRVPQKVPQPWLHKDQCPSSKEELSVQGIYSAAEVGPTDAGTVLVPGSHRKIYAWERGCSGQHLKVPDEHLGKFESSVVKPFVPRNGLLLFNSRLIHANTPATKMREQTGPGGLPLPNRLALAICFAPRSRRSEETRAVKEKAYYQGRTSNHWPCDRFSLKRPRLWDFIRGGRALPPPPCDRKRLDLL